MTDRPPLPPRRRCIVSVDGVRCPNQPRYPGRDESSFCATHDDADHPETKAWQQAVAQVPAQEHTFQAPDGRVHCRCGLGEVERLAQVPAQEERLDVARKAASAMRIPAERIREAIAALRGPMDMNEAIVIGCADAVAWALGVESKEKP